jgi:hypothetical protein
MTIHRAIGADFGSVVSCVGDGKDGYKLWQKEQVEVLISRTHTLSDLTFVGSSPEQTADHLVELLFKQSAYSLYMRHVVTQMTNPEGMTPVIHPLRYLPYNVRNVIIPTHSNGFVYLLLSLRDHNSTYIGQTKNLSTRLTQHNSGCGTIVTANPRLRPWHVIGFITGFLPDEKHRRTAIEQAWQSRRNLAGKYSLNPLEVLQIGKDLLQEMNELWYSDAQLNFVQCIEFKLHC